MSRAKDESGFWKLDIRTFASIFLSLLLLVLYPILRADRYCNDDLIRAFLGNYGWNNNGRLLTNFVMRVLQLGGQRLVDISPVPQILAAGIIALTGALLARRFEIRPWLLAVCVVLPLGAQPFFLENLSYKFDAPCMALGLFFAVLPIVVIRRNWVALGAGVLSLLACLNFYQPTINAFLIFAMLEVFALQMANSNFAAEARCLFVRMLQFISALVVYQIVFSSTLKDWMKQHAALISQPHVAQKIGGNAVDFYHYIAGAFPARWIAVLAPFALVTILIPMVASCLVTVARRDGRPHWQTAISLIFAFLLPLAAIVSVAGPMLLLEQPILMPRVLPSIGALLSASGIATFLALRPRPSMLRWQYVASGIWILAMVVFASIYGNALSAQKNYEARIAAHIADDLAEFRVNHSVNRYLVVGSAEWPAVVERTANEFSLLRTLVLPYLREDDFNTRNYLMYWLDGVADYRSETHSSEELASILQQACASTIVFQRNEYRIALVDDVAIVGFLRKPSSPCTSSDRPSKLLPIANIKTLEEIK